MKTVIYGSTDTGRRIYDEINDKTEVIAFIDDDTKKWGDSIYGITICDPRDIVKMDYDEVVIGVLTYHMEVLENLLSLGVPRGKINELYVNIPTFARIECLKNVKQLIDDGGIYGNCAELGVFRGEFAREINRVFSDRKLYLFDTFEGFNDKDTRIELEKNYTDKNKEGYFANTSEEIVLRGMTNKNNCIIKKGFFPDTTEGLEDVFCFVNLDADLYAPTKSGLEYFYPRMSMGGIIFVHDYFSKAFFGVKDAVNEFCNKEGTVFLPIGDTLSVAIRKN